MPKTDKTSRSTAFYEQRCRETNWPPYDLCDPPTPANLALRILIDELLDPNWYVTIPENQDQTNTAAVHEILKRYVDNQKRDNRITGSMTLIATMIGVVIGVIIKSVF